MPVIRNPDVLRDLDVLIMESTYGNRFHSRSEEVEEEVAKVIREAIAKTAGKLLFHLLLLEELNCCLYSSQII